jgi:hypothetical protein
LLDQNEAQRLGQQLRQDFLLRRFDNVLHQFHPLDG